MNRGYVYILSNPAMPGVYKIGRTTRSLECRMKELFQTGVPAPFKEEYSVLSPNCNQLEEAMHLYFAECRISEGREFFSCDLHEATNIIEELLVRQCQLFVDEFCSDHVLVLEYKAVDTESVEVLARDLGIRDIEVFDVFNHVTADELRPALIRQKMKRDGRLASIRKKTALTLVT